VFPFLFAGTAVLFVLIIVIASMSSKPHYEYKAPKSFVVSEASVTKAVEGAINHSDGSSGLASKPELVCTKRENCAIDYTVKAAVGDNPGSELIAPTRQLWKTMFEDPKLQDAQIIVSGPGTSVGGKHGKRVYFSLLCNRADDEQINWDSVQPSGIETVCEYIPVALLEATE
jgi:hypothetical protein